MSRKIAEGMVPGLYRLRRVRKETSDTYTLELEAGSGERVLPYMPGQFNMVYAYGVGEVPISFSGDPSRPGVVVHTIRAVGAVTKALCALKPGGTVGIRGPFGNPWPIGEAESNDVLIVAGGIGLAPLRSAIYAVLSNRKKYGKVTLLYGCRTPRDMIFRRELEKWRGRFDLEVEITVDSAEADWFGNVGVVTTLIRRAHFDRYNTIAMVCGPELMMRYTVQELGMVGLSQERIYLSMERNMKCGTGFCGHCQYGPEFICKDGPVFSFDRIRNIFTRREI